jgi:hypothetical protein
MPRGMNYCLPNRTRRESSSRIACRVPRWKMQSCEPTKTISGAYSYLKEVLLDMTEVLGILLVLELFWAGLPLVFIVNQFWQEALAASELCMLLHQILVVWAPVYQSPGDRCRGLWLFELTFSNEDRGDSCTYDQSSIEGWNGVLWRHVRCQVRLNY